MNMTETISTKHLTHKKQDTKTTSTLFFCPVDRICVTVNDVSAVLVCCRADVTGVLSCESMFSLLTAMVGFDELLDTNETGML